MGDRTATDLPVPLSPMMRTPPMVGSMTFNMRANFMSSWSAILTNGSAGSFTAGATLSSVAAAAQTLSDASRLCNCKTCFHCFAMCFGHPKKIVQGLLPK